MIADVICENDLCLHNNGHGGFRALGIKLEVKMVGKNNCVLACSKYKLDPRDEGKLSDGKDDEKQ